MSPTSSLKTSSRTNGESLKLNRLSLARTMSFRTPTKSSAESDKKPAVFDSRRSTPVKQITGNSTTRSLNTSSEQQPANDNLNVCSFNYLNQVLSNLSANEAPTTIIFFCCSTLTSYHLRLFWLHLERRSFLLRGLNF